MYRWIKSIIFLLMLVISLSISSSVYAATVKIDTDNLNIRNGPSLESDVIGQADTGETYQLNERKDGWVSIYFNNSIAWVSSEYVTISDENNEKNHDQTVHVQKDSIPTETKNNPNALLKNKVIVIDPGHGGRDVGAIGVSGGYEKKYVLHTAHNLKTYLEHLGAIVHLTRETDNYKMLSSRASYANYQRADVFLSLHYNSSPQYPSVKGIGTFFYDKNDETFASIMQEELIKTTNSEDRHAQFGDFQVLRTNHQPALLLELGFISNAAEELNIQTIAYQRKISQGVMAGLQKYFLMRETD
ncbi:N-acetylmuramoyl-L-alanine amidase [Paraliobacillus ryukyuensis]|uniref:N-acetylmuramoyl-L-alanine amidase n=1 Tax=Paraliobacillus ryukyuensis TaxID=200904 RepID=UPI0009A7AC1A|nr:N-acetylmuramoyl-L-alanine amidase [Paraliobacillus ryukyuensis]